MISTKIDVHAKTLSMEFKDTSVKFNIFEALKHPAKGHSSFSIDGLKAIRWILDDLPRINPSICMHKILLEEDARPIRQHQWRLNLTLLDVIKNEVTKYLRSLGLWSSRTNKTRWFQPGFRTVDEKLNQATCKDHFPLPFVDQVLENLANSYSTCGLTQDYLHMFVRNVRIYKDVVRTLQCPEYFLEMHDQHLLEPLGGLHGDSNLVLNIEKCHFMVTEGIILGHLVSARGIKVDKAKIDVISSLSNPASMWEVHSFLGHAGDSSKISARLPYLCQASTEGHRLRLRLALCGRISGAEEKAYVHAHPPSTKLGVVVRAHVRGLQLYSRSSPRPMNSPSQLYYHRKGALGNSFSLEKFRSYLLGSKIVFNVEIRDKKGVENAIADHLSWLEREVELITIQDEFLGEQIM
ncbi:hypothetical protein CR513_31693, partial [Mucuna pruriens]